MLLELIRNRELRIKAAQAVLDGGLGLPTQPVDVYVSRALAKRLVECSAEELRAIEAHLAESAIDITPTEYC
jgi:endonuclease III